MSLDNANQFYAQLCRDKKLLQLFSETTDKKKFLQQFSLGSEEVEYLSAIDPKSAIKADQL